MGPLAGDKELGVLALGVQGVLFRPVRYADLADGQACLAWSLPASTAWPFRWSA